MMIIKSGICLWKWISVSVINKCECNNELDSCEMEI